MSDVDWSSYATTIVHNDREAITSSTQDERIVISGCS